MAKLRRETRLSTFSSLKPRCSPFTDRTGKMSRGIKNIRNILPSGSIIE
jgi:hypothetical protein